MRVINPPGGKTNINIYREELIDNSQVITVNKCQEERMKSSIFDGVYESKKDIQTNQNEVICIVEQKKISDEVDDIKCCEEKKIAGVPTITALGSIYSNGRLPHRKISPLSVRNNQSHIFD
ncbi:uncharacterized protein LOC105846887 [Hydra vulgaris]|uniref:uncharacterized protein LOC105846887 n=1 Tax=Hydra vulgaris TaxID=6087 RepID=UPI000641629C|nr:uncharacterized protein LOC105846887 isoform X2 [Hydra vulgaris]